MRIGIVGHNKAENCEERLLTLLPSHTTVLVIQADDPLLEEVKSVAHTLRLPLRHPQGKFTEEADEFLIFWDGEQAGNNRLASSCIRRGKPTRLLPLK